MGQFKTAVFIILITCVFISAQSFPNQRVDSLLNTSIKLMLNQKYDEALNLSWDLQKISPKTPWAELNSAGVYIMESFDFGLTTNKKVIDSLLDAAEEKSSALLDSEPANPWNLFFMGSTKGFEAYFFISQEDFLSAITEAFFAIQYYNQCLKVDSTFYQAYMPIGNYLFWRSVKTEFLHWLPFVEDESAKGLAMLEKSYGQSVYNNYLAANSLCWAYIYLKNYSRAETISSEMLSMYPNSRVFKLTLARAYQESDPIKAVEVLNQVRDELNGIEKLTVDKNVELLFRAGMILFKRGDINKAQVYFNKILSLEFTGGESSVTLDRVERIKELSKSGR